MQCSGVSGTYVTTVRISVRSQLLHCAHPSELQANTGSCSTHHGTPLCSAKQRVIRVGGLLDHLVDDVGPPRVREDLQAGEASISTHARRSVTVAGLQAKRKATAQPATAVPAEEDAAVADDAPSQSQ